MKLINILNVIINAINVMVHILIAMVDSLCRLEERSQYTSSQVLYMQNISIKEQKDTHLLNMFLILFTQMINFMSEISESIKILTKVASHPYHTAFKGKNTSGFQKDISHKLYSIFTKIYLAIKVINA